MPYRFLDDVATADVAFEADGKTLEELFLAAAEATMNVMVENLDSIEPKVNQSISVNEENIEMLLFKFLQEFIFYKDADSLLLRVKDINIREDNQAYHLTAQTAGEEVNLEKHRCNVDVKAVTMHQFKVERTKDGYQARVVLDI